MVLLLKILTTYAFLSILISLYIFLRDLSSTKKNAKKIVDEYNKELRRMLKKRKISPRDYNHYYKHFTEGSVISYIIGQLIRSPFDCPVFLFVILTGDLPEKEGDDMNFLP